MAAIHFPDPGALVDTEWANAADVLTPLRKLSGVIDLGSSHLHAGRLSVDPSDPIGWEAGLMTTLYLHPYRGVHSINRAEDGSLVLSEIPAASGASLDISAYATGLYDIFEYDENGAVAIEAQQWTSWNVRGYSLTRDPVLGYVKPVDPTRKWRGAIRINSGTVPQTVLWQSIYNAFNRHWRSLFRQSTTASWGYSTPNTWRVATNMNAVFTIVAPLDGLVAHASYEIGVGAAGGTTKIAVATSGQNLVYTDQFATRIAGQGGIRAGGVLTLGLGYQNVAPREWVAVSATFAGQAESGLSLLWEC